MKRETLNQFEIRLDGKHYEVRLTDDGFSDNPYMVAGYNGTGTIRDMFVSSFATREQAESAYIVKFEEFKAIAIAMLTQ